MLTYFGDPGLRITKTHVRQFLTHHDIDPDSMLSGPACRYLQLLRSCSKPMGLIQIACIVGLDPAYVSREIEPALAEEGHLQRTSRGRELTPSGRALADKLIQENQPEDER